MEILHFPLNFVFVLPKTPYLLLLILFKTLDNNTTNSYQQRCLPSSNFPYLRIDKMLSLNVLIHLFLSLKVLSVDLFLHFH